MTNEMPKGWKSIKLNDIINTSQIGVVKPKREQNNIRKGVPYIKMDNVTTDGKVLFDNVVHVKAEKEEIDKYSILKGDILFNTRNSSELVGKTGIVSTERVKTIYNNNLMRIRTFRGIIPEFVLWQMCSPMFKDNLEKVKRATTNVAAIYAKDLFPLPFLLAPEPEQQRIVSKIDELLTKLDAGIKSLKQVQILLKKYRQSVLKSAVEGKLTTDWRKQQKDELESADKLLERILKERKEKLEAEQLANFKAKGKTPPKNWQNKYIEPTPPDASELPELPDGWVWLKLVQITSVLGDGLHGTPVYSEEGDYYFINGNNLSDGKIEIKDNTKRVTNEEYEKYKKALNKNTILVSINGTLGKTSFYNGEKVILGKSACYFNVLDSVNKHYIRYFITSQRFISYAYKNATGSTIKNVSLKAMREFEISIPLDLQEQQAIVNEIDSRLSVCDKMEEAVEDSLKKAKALQQSILKRAFEGKLVPQDPNDEPASVLLERIKAEKSKPKKSKQMEMF